MLKKIASFATAQKSNQRAREVARRIRKITKIHTFREFAYSKVEYPLDSDPEYIEKFLETFEQQVRREETEVHVPTELGWSVQKARKIANPQWREHSEKYSFYFHQGDARWEQRLGGVKQPGDNYYWGGFRIQGHPKFVHTIELGTRVLDFSGKLDGKQNLEKHVGYFATEIDNLLLRVASCSLPFEGRLFLRDLIQKRLDLNLDIGGSSSRHLVLDSGHQIYLRVETGFDWTARYNGDLTALIHPPNWQPGWAWEIPSEANSP